MADLFGWQCATAFSGVSILAVARSLEECDGDDPLSRAAPAKQQVHKDVNVLTTCVLASYKEHIHYTTSTLTSDEGCAQGASKVKSRLEFQGSRSLPPKDSGNKFE